MTFDQAVAICTARPMTTEEFCTITDDMDMVEAVIGVLDNKAEESDICYHNLHMLAHEYYMVYIGE